MTTAQVYKNLGKFIESDEKKIGQGTKIVIRYTQPNYQDPQKVWEMGQFEDKISDELVDKIATLKKGQEICVHTVKNANGYADLHDISGPEDVPQKKDSSTYQKKSKNSNWQPKDETGVAVGAAWTNAIEILKLSDSSKGESAGKLIAEVEHLVSIILDKKLAQEAKLRADKPKDSPKEEEKKEEKPLSKLEQMKAKKAANKEKEEPKENNKNVPWDEEQDVANDLDDIEF